MMARDARLVIRLSSESLAQLREAAGIDGTRLWGRHQRSVAAYVRRVALAHAVELIRARDARVATTRSTGSQSARSTGSQSARGGRAR